MKKEHEASGEDFIGHFLIVVSCQQFELSSFLMLLLLVHSFLLSLASLSVRAVSLPFTVRSDTTHRHLPRQSSTTAIVPVGNTQNAFYYSNITLGGRQISVMLDTGRYGPLFICLPHSSLVNSSDLWVTGSVPGAQDTGKSLTLSYAVGNAAGMSSVSHLRLVLTHVCKGDIYTAPFQFDNYTVQDQAFRQFHSSYHAA